MKNSIRVSVLAVSLALTAVFFFAYYDFYLKRRDCAQELGRCFDSESGVVYLEQSGIAWLSFGLLSMSVALYQLWRLTR